MGSQVLRPDLTHDSAYWSAVGAANPLAAVTDESDAIYVEILGGRYDRWLIFRLADLAPLPPRAIVRSVTVSVRATRPSSGFSSMYVWLSFPWRVGLRPIAEIVLDQLTVRDNGLYVIPLQGGLSQLVRPDDQRWDEAGVNDLEVWFSPAGPSPNHTGDVRLNRVAVTVDYNEPPHATAMIPTDLTVTSKPVLRWLYQDADGDRQQAYHVKLFSGLADVADPATETARLIWDSGVVRRTDNYAEPPPLPNGPYRFAVTVSDPFSDNVQEGPANLLTFRESTFTSPFGVADWTAGSNSTISSFAGSDGNDLMQVHSNAAGNTSAFVTRKIACTPGERVSVDAIFQPLSVGRNLLCFIDYFDGAGAFISSTIGAQTLALLSEWTPAQVVGNAPANAATFRAGVQYLGAAAAGEIVRVDNVVQRRANRYWAQESFTLNVIGPQTPTAFVTAEPVNHRVKIDVTAPAVVAPAPAPQYFIVERFRDGRWEPIRHGDRFAPAVPVGTNTIYDYEWEALAGSVFYRATAVTEAPGVPVSSLHSVVAAVVMAPVSGAWYLTDFLADVPVVVTANLAPGIAFTIPKRDALQEPMGSEFNVVVSDGVRGREWPLVIECLDNASYANIEAAHALDRTLLLRGPTGQWYVRLFGDMGVTQREGGSNPSRTVNVTAVETAMPTL